MFLIASASYCTSELQSEFGKLPPAFLPLGNKRLFQHQISLIPKNRKVYLSLPEGVEINIYDRKWLQENNTQVLFLPENLSLGESIVAAINLMGYEKDKELSLLFGDTLFLNYPTEKNCFSVSRVDENYRWSFFNQTNEVNKISENSQISENANNLIINGYFHFSDPLVLIQSIISARWNFVSALNLYKKQQHFCAKEVFDWLDFGHIHTYFRSKTIFTTQRSFNQLSIDQEFVTKSSKDKRKIEAEANWFLSLPGKLKKFTPHFIDVKHQKNKCEYTIEYLYNISLNELYVFSTLPNITWNKIFDACFNFIIRCQSYQETKNSFYLNEMLISKTNARIKNYIKATGIDLDQRFIFNQSYSFSLNELIYLADHHSPKASFTNNIIHGDFCFSNILYDFRSASIKTYDPRGILNDGQLSIYGDYRYDLAKLAHSVIGQYDWIIADYFMVEIGGDYINFDLLCSTEICEIKKLFINKIYDKFKLTYVELLAMQIHLFLSMLPLHQDNIKRQEALFANAFRLAVLLKEEVK